MYKEYFGFTQYPFGKDISTDQLLHYRGFMEYNKRMEFLQKHGGIGVIWGLTGSGKTAGLRYLRDSLNKNRYKFYYMAEPPLSVAEFYRGIAQTMDIEPACRRMDTYQKIRDHILSLSVEKKITPIIALDECQMYPHTVLEGVRLFLNFEIDSKDHAILILCGQPELKKRLQYYVYEPLTQRITVHYQFDGLTPEEVEKYLEHRLSIAGVKHQLFEPHAIQFIYQVTKGILRKIDTLAVKSLVLAAGLNKQSIDKAIVETVMQETLWA